MQIRLVDKIRLIESKEQYAEEIIAAESNAAITEVLYSGCRFLCSLNMHADIEQYRGD